MKWGTHILSVCGIGLGVKDPLIREALGLRTKAWNQWLERKGHREAAFGTDPPTPRQRLAQGLLFIEGKLRPREGEGQAKVTQKASVPGPRGGTSLGAGLPVYPVVI